MTAFARYHLVALGGMLVNLVVLQVLTGIFHGPPLPSNLAGLGLGAISNYGLSTRWAWRLRRPAARALRINVQQSELMRVNA